MSSLDSCLPKVELRQGPTAAAQVSELWRTAPQQGSAPGGPCPAETTSHQRQACKRRLEHVMNACGPAPLRCQKSCPADMVSWSHTVRLKGAGRLSSPAGNPSATTDANKSRLDPAPSLDFLRASHTSMCLPRSVAVNLPQHWSTPGMPLQRAGDLALASRAELPSQSDHGGDLERLPSRSIPGSLACQAAGDLPPWSSDDVSVQQQSPSGESGTNESNEVAQNDWQPTSITSDFSTRVTLDDLAPQSIQTLLGQDSLEAAADDEGCEEDDDSPRLETMATMRISSRPMLTPAHLLGNQMLDTAPNLKTYQNDTPDRAARRLERRTFGVSFKTSARLFEFEQEGAASERLSDAFRITHIPLNDCEGTSHVVSHAPSD